MDTDIFQDLNGFLQLPDDTQNPFSPITRVYNQQELATINEFKNDYMEAATPAARKTICQFKIFPAIFNYWASIGEVIDEENKVSRSKQLLRWVRNTWRHPKKVSSKFKNYRLTDVLWWEKKEDVLKEIAALMGLKSVTTYTPGWIRHRTRASKNILNSMPESKKNELKEMAVNIAKHGFSEENQRKFAEEKWRSRFSRSAKEDYNEMGLVSISIVAYTRKNGQLAVNIHDNIAEIIGVPCKSFEQMYEEKTDAFKRDVMEYVRIVKARAGSGTSSGQPSQPTLVIDQDPDKFPVAPSPPSWSKVTKDELEKLYRTYITQHYRLASGSENRQAPFTQIAEKPSNFILNKYVPRGISLDEPRAMKREAIIKFFKHIAAREETHGIHDAFRFKAVQSSRKKGNLGSTHYFDDDQPETVEEQDPVEQLASDTPEPGSARVNPALGGANSALGVANSALGGATSALGRANLASAAHLFPVTPAMTPEVSTVPLEPDRDAVPKSKATKRSLRAMEKRRAIDSGHDQDSQPRRKSRRSQRSINKSQAESDPPLQHQATSIPNCNLEQLLSLDPAFIRDPPIFLDPELEYDSFFNPTINQFESLNEDITTPWPIPSSFLNVPNPGPSDHRFESGPAHNVSSLPTILPNRRSPRNLHPR